jgi:hypothetical protein
MTTAEAIYLLCAATSLLAAFLLLRHFSASRTALLLWSCIAFLGLAINNVLVYVDLVLVPSTDLSIARTVAGVVAFIVLLYGLIWDTRG